MRMRYCRKCGKMHDVSAWPEACRDQPEAKRSDLSAPYIQSDIEPYRSISTPDRPVISGRAQEREYLDRNGLIKHEDAPKTSKPLQAPGGIEMDIKRAYDDLVEGRVDRDQVAAEARELKSDLIERDQNNAA